MITSDLLRISSDFSHNPHALLFHRVGQLVGLRLAGYYFIAYSYAKWIDDTIDRPETGRPQSGEFLDRQDEVVAGTRAPVCRGERLGAELGRMLASARGRRLLPSWRKLMEGFRWDVSRRGIIPSLNELDRRVALFGCGSLGLIEGILGTEGALDAAFMRDASEVYIRLDMLLDVEEDARIGYFNVSREEMDLHRITDPSSRAQLLPWMRHRVGDLAGAFGRAERALHSLPFRLRLFFLGQMRRRRRKLDRLADEWSRS